jgi:hypothetical protein
MRFSKHKCLEKRMDIAVMLFHRVTENTEKD